MADIDLIIAVHTDGIKQVTDLSASLRQLNTSINGVFVPMAKMDAHTRALNKALGVGARGAREHATSLRQLKANQQILGAETKKLTRDIKAMQAAMRASGATEFINPRSISQLKALSGALKNAKLRAFSSDMQSIGLNLKKLGKDAQFVGRSLMINLTAPFTLMARYGLKALIDIDKEAIRLTKVMDGVAMSIEQAMAKTGQSADSELVKELTQNYEFLDKALTDVSAKYGIAKSLTVGLAADFAELGLGAKESVAAITNLTAATEKLGGMDISQSQDLVQALYFQSVRAFDQAGRAFESAAAKEAAAISAATAQLQLFNAIENTTALTMRDLGDAFPEVASMATTFGLSMTEAAAMLAPMKAAGLEVGASANAIKVSLQRLVAPTKANAEMLASLSESYKNTTQGSQAFNNATRSGLTGLLGIVESFTAVKDSSAGMEGALQMMAKIFGVRQGPRMTIAIQQLAQFNDELTKADPLGQSVAKTLVNLANGASNSSKLAIKNFTDIGIIARVATAQVGQQVENFGVVTVKDIKDANAARKAVADEILKANREGRDIMSEISTEAGRSMIVELAGSASASVLAQRELDASLKSLDITVSRIKNNFKLFAADLIKNMRPAIEKIADITSSLITKWNNLSASTKKTISIFILSLMGALAAIGPLILAFGTLSSVTGIAMRGVFKFLPDLKKMDGGFIGLTETIKGFGRVSGEASRKFTDSFNTAYASFINKKSLFDGPGGAITLGKAGRGGFGAMSAADEAIASSAKFSKLITKPLASEMPVMAGAKMPSVTAAMVDSQRKALAKSMGYYKHDIDAAVKAMRDPKLYDALSKKGKEIFGLGQRAVPAVGVPAGPLNASKVQLDLQKKLGELSKKSSAARYKIEKDIFDLRVAEYELSRKELKARGVAARDEYKRSLMGPFKPKGPDFDPSLYTGGRKSLKTRLFEQAGITSRLEKDSGGKLFAQRMFSGRDVTDIQAAKLTKGGFGATLTKLGLGKQAFGEKTGLKLKQLIPRPSSVKDLGGIATGGAKKAFGAAMDSNPMMGAKLAVQGLKEEFKAIDGSAPGTFKKISAAVKGFTSESGKAKKLIGLMKFGFAGLGVGLILGTIAVLVIAVMRNFEAFKKTGEKGMFALKRVLKILKDTLGELIRPVLDLFAAFGSGSDQGSSAAEGIGKAFTALMSVVEKTANFIKAIVVQVIQPIFYSIANVVAAVVSIFQGEWGKAAGYLVSAIGFALKLVINIVIAGMKGFVSLFGLGVKAVLTYFTLIPKAVAKIFSFLAKIPGIGGMFKTVGNGINAVVDGMFGLVDAGTGAVNGLLDAAGKMANKGLDALTSKGIGKSVGNALGGAKKDAEDGGNAIGEVANEAISNATGEGLGDKVKDAVAGAYKDAMKDLAQKLQDYVMGEMSNALGKLQKNLEEALKKQKDAALGVYDSQIDTLEKLAKAEESLTKTKEYEAARREAIEERALQSQNYIRNRALAIYEGRIDDARMLDLQDRKDAIDSTKSIGQIDSSRKKDLAAENLDALKAAITAAREEADKFFETTATKFGESAAEILKFPPVTKQDYIDQMTSLTELAKTTANDSGIEFSKMFDAFASSINSKMPNDVVGAFTTNLDDLVKVAVERYGLGKGSADNSTIIGSTIGMLMDMGGVMGDNKQFVVDSFGEITTGLKDNMSTGLTEITTTIYSKFVTDFDKAVTDADPTTVYQKAIKDGNKSIIDDFRKTVDGVGSEVDNMKDLLDPLIKKWAELEAKAKAAGDAQAAAASGGGGTSGLTDPSKAVKPVGYYGSVDTYLSRVAVANRLPTLKPGAGTKWMGGMIPSFARGGYLDKAMSQSIPAMLHGGEYIISSKAVQNIGAATLQNLNNMRFNAPRNSAPSAGQSVTMSTQNTNIYVDNFIGEEEWFNSMMKEYNVNVLPKNQKAAGVQPRVVRSYNGINQGL
jgi:TP901 family phage tail tape measure protein